MKLTRTSGLSILLVVLLAPALWLFADQDKSPVNERTQVAARENIQAETVTVDISREQGALATFTLENMLAGDDFRGSMVVQNIDDVLLGYEVTSSVEGSPLNQFMTMRFWIGGVDCSVEALPSKLLHNGSLARGLSGVTAELGPLEQETLCAQIVLADVGDLDAQKEMAKIEFKILAVTAS